MTSITITATHEHPSMTEQAPRPAFATTTAAIDGPDVGEIHLGRAQADRVAQAIAASHLLDERPSGWILEDLGAPKHDGDGIDHLQCGDVSNDEQAKQLAGDPRDYLGRVEDPSFGEPVRDHAAPGSEQQNGQRLERGHDAERRSGASY